MPRFALRKPSSAALRRSPESALYQFRPVGSGGGVTDGDGGGGVRTQSLGTGCNRAA